MDALFVSSFKTPGHVPLLITAEGLLEKRQGHTEMSVYLTKTKRNVQFHHPMPMGNFLRLNCYILVN